jgi:hypothetical protein
MTIALGHKVHPREWADYILIFRNPVEPQICGVFNVEPYGLANFLKLHII